MIMSNPWNRRLAAWLLGALMLATTPLIRAADERPPALVDAGWLRQQLAGSAPPLVLDASPGPAHAARHIAGAVHVDYFAYGLRDGTPAERERWLQSLGVGAGRRIVVYDQGGTYYAPRLFHELLYSGVAADDLFLLDGGLTRWLADGGAATAERTPPPARGDFRVGSLREELRVRLPEFLLASGDSQRHALVDALGPDYYYGAAKFFDRGGHVPDALLWPAEDFFNPDKTFKSAAEIRRMAAWLGVRPEQTVHTHCGGGGAAAVPFFALRVVAGFPRVTLYRESHLEWLRDERGLPFWTYAAPALQRDAAWLDAWGSGMMRAIGLARLSVIDLRSESDYRLGHVPYSVNVGAQAFATHATQPQALSVLLGSAGVDAAHEAVLVSEGGLNGRSASAFVLLQHMGQRRVALLAESVDEWGLRGHALTKEPTTVGPRRSPQDLAVPVATYPAGPDRGVVIREPGAAAGPHPRVFVAAGVAAPVRRPGSTPWVHLPHTQVVNADGSFKPAKDIWKALATAGVPRYAELISFADDPGEAAMNYVALKLMGFTDVKVWWP
jgi:3-mercaptopyruvate sulfurtransferase SseA